MFLKRSLLVAAALAMFAMPAIAADLPVKAQQLPAALMYPTAGGFYFGVTAGGLGGTVASDVVAGAMFGGNIGVNAGYTGKIGNSFWFAENIVSAQGLNAGNGANKLTVNASVSIEQRLAFGAPLNVVQQWVGLFPGLGAIAMPSVPTLGGNVIVAQNPYAFLSLHEDDTSASTMTQFGRSWLVSWGGGAGLLSRLSNGMMLDTSVEYVHGSQGIELGGVAGKVVQSDKYLVAASLKF